MMNTRWRWLTTGALLGGVLAAGVTGLLPHGTAPKYRYLSLKGLPVRADNRTGETEILYPDSSRHGAERFAWRLVGDPERERASALAAVDEQEKRLDALCDPNVVESMIRRSIATDTAAGDEKCGP